MPTSLFSDSYDRADGSIGPNYTQLGPDTIVIVSNAVPMNFGNNNIAYVNAISWPAAQYAQVSVSSLSGTGGEGPGVLLRCDGTLNNWYWATVNADALIDIRRVASGSGASVATRDAVSWTSGDILRAEIEGGTIRVYKNGVQVGADYVDGSPLASGSAGLAYGSGAAGTIDDFEGGALATAVVEYRFSEERFPKVKLRRDVYPVRFN